MKKKIEKENIKEIENVKKGGKKMRTKMGMATDIILEQMVTINNLSKKGSNKKLNESINVGRVLNAGAANLIKEASITLSMMQYANKTKTVMPNVAKEMGIMYND